LLAGLSVLADLGSCKRRVLRTCVESQDRVSLQLLCLPACGHAPCCDGQGLCLKVCFPTSVLPMKNSVANFPGSRGESICPSSCCREGTAVFT
ncbi:mCG1040791, isoform CRA_a, partial [Mus musculus]